MFAPEGAEHTQFDRVGLPVQPVDDHVVFRLGQGDFIEDFLVDGHYYLPRVMK